MPFEKTTLNPDDLVLEEFSSGNITVTIRAYAFGQQRIQVSVDGGWKYPDIIGPEC